jgi:hypothetical protein
MPDNSEHMNLAHHQAQSTLAHMSLNVGASRTGRGASSLRALFSDLFREGGSNSTDRVLRAAFWRGEQPLGTGEVVTLVHRVAPLRRERTSSPA